MLYGRENPHGGGRYGKPVRLDFSVNTNPLGTPPAVIRAVEASVCRLCQYPDPSCRALVAALAAYEEVPAERILCGSGAAELIFSYCAALRPRRALELAPTFSEYAAALEAVGCRVERHFLRREDGFSLGEDFLRALARTDCDVVFLCNPNNPTGRLASPAVLEEVCAVCRRRSIRLFVDECFLELSDGGREGSLKGHLGEMPGLLLLKAFTKSHAMAGLRLGYCLGGDRALLEAMSRQVQPWNVSLPAQEAGVAALGETAYLEEARRLIGTERARLRQGLEGMGLFVCPSQANFLLLQSASELRGPLLERGILIRDCANYHGLGRGWYRVAVKRREENQALLDALAAVV